MNSWFLQSGDSPDNSVRMQGIYMILKITDKNEEFRKIGQPAAIAYFSTIYIRAKDRLQREALFHYTYSNLVGW